jgi:O-antigen/teichoic acid export membrane protein
VPSGCLLGHFFYIILRMRSSLPDSPDPQPFTEKLRKRFQRAITLFSGQSARQGYLAVIDQSIISLANFVATLILARNISMTELGMYSVGFTLLRLVRAVQEGLTIQPLNTFGAAQDLPEFKRYATSTSLIQILLALFSALGTAILGSILILIGKDTVGPTIFILWFAFLTWEMQEYIRRMLYTRGMVFAAVMNTAIANLARLGLMLLWLSQGKLTGIAGLEAIAWGSLVALIPGIWQTRNFWTRNFDPIRQTFLKNWHFGRWVMGGVLANWVTVEFYPVMTAGMISFAAAGAYRAIQNLVAPIHMLLRAIDTFLTPRASKIYQQTRFRGLSRLLRITYIVTGVPIFIILLISVVFSKQILYLLYGTTYLQYSNALILMAIFYALMYAYYPLQTALKAIHVSQPIFIANVLAIISMFTLGIWTIQRWGVYGTIIGQIINSLIVAIVLWLAWWGVWRNQKATTPS